jgi:hypothetical protein
MKRTPTELAATRLAVTAREDASMYPDLTLPDTHRDVVGARKALRVRADLARLRALKRSGR